MRRYFVIILALTQFIILNSSGQDIVRKQYKATKILVPPVINGILDEEIWNTTGEWIDDFTQNEPYDGRPASQRTDFKILFDENNLYVAFKAYDTSPDSIVNRLTRRDHTDGDLVGIILDSYHDLRTGFLFGVSSAGVKYDLVFSNDGENEDETWDPNWWVKTSVNKEGWIAEMKIPFSQVRFEKNSGDVWGLEMARVLYRKNETSFWQPIARDAPGFMHLIGELTGLEQIKPRKIFDITPYGIAKTERYATEPGNPFVTGKASSLNGGLDAKIGVTNNLTMDLTVNPDFGQVEADPSVVNLTAYETFFEEKRPFFIEGNNIINFGIGIGDGGIGNDNLFYSRRIGRTPQGDTYNYYGFADTLSGYSDSPINTPIIGAAKLSGKTKEGISVGFLDAVTAETMAEIDTGGHRSFQTIEPLTNYLATRLQKDYKQGNTIIGGMFTMVNRNMDEIPISGSDDRNLVNQIPNAAFTGGFDFTQYFHNKNYMFNVNTAFSRISGTELAIVQAQRSSARYFQKPGNYISLDSSRTSLSGNGGRVQFQKSGNGHWNYLAAFLWKTPGLELNDIGYLREADQLFELLAASYRVWEPKGFYREYHISSNQYSVWDFSGNHLFNGVNLNGNLHFRNYWFAGGGSEFSFNVITNSLLRGGPVMKMPAGLNAWFNLGTDNRKKLVISLSLNHSNTFEDGARSYNISPQLTYKPMNTLSLSLTPSYMKSFDELQYVDQTKYASEDRYIFASIDQKVLSMSLRVNFTLTPELTFQYWGQPFLASGKYYDYKYITDPVASEYHNRFHTYTSEECSLVTDPNNGDYYKIDENKDGSVDYTIEKPDFNFKQFLSNFVIRWEYNPGSTVYLVWSQNRSGSETVGMMDVPENMEDLFNVKPHNVFLIKFSYRFGLR
jgi:hypothetical protein